MSLFGTLTNDGLEESQDRLGGFAPKDTDVYLGVIKLAYAIESAGGAKGVFLNVLIDGQEYRESVYVTDKKGNNYYNPKGDASKREPLPGFTTIDDLCMVTAEVPLSKINIEEKEVMVYDFDQRQEVRKSVPVLIDLLNQKALFAIVRSKQDKKKKTDDGSYVPTGEIIEVNNIEKVFHHEARVTVPEARAGKTEGEFIVKWIDRNKGQIRDKTESNSGKGGKPSTAVKPTPGSSVSAPARTSLFAKKT